MDCLRALSGYVKLAFRKNMRYVFNLDTLVYIVKGGESEKTTRFVGGIHQE